VGLGAGMDGYGIPRPLTRFNPWTFQPVANRYTDYANPDALVHTHRHI